MSIGIDQIRGIRDDLPGVDQPSGEEFREWAFGKRILKVNAGGNNFMGDWGMETDHALALFAELLSHPDVPDVKKRMLYNSLMTRLRWIIQMDLKDFRQEDEQWCVECLTEKHHSVIVDYCNTYKEVDINPEKFKASDLDFEAWELEKLRKGEEFFGEWPEGNIKITKAL